MPRLEALAHRVLTGDVILPKFQRQFVWSRQQTLDLWMFRRVALVYSSENRWL